MIREKDFQLQKLKSDLEQEQQKIKNENEIRETKRDDRSVLSMHITPAKSRFLQNDRQKKEGITTPDIWVDQPSA